MEDVFFQTACEVYRDGRVDPIELDLLLRLRERLRLDWRRAGYLMAKARAGAGALPVRG